jgi:hypothetical protein
LRIRTTTIVAASAVFAAMSASVLTSPAAIADNGSYLGAMKSLGLGSKGGDEARRCFRWARPLAECSPRVPP